MSVLTMVCICYSLVNVGVYAAGSARSVFARLGRKGEVMKWDTKVLICMCGAMAVLAHIQGNYHVASGWVVAFAGWFVVGLKERREVK